MARVAETPVAAGEPRRLARAAEIVRVLAQSGLCELVAGSPSDEEVADLAPRLRAGFEELGPTFCKLGQILSTRTDLLSPVLIDQLSSLRRDVPPMPATEVMSVIETELRAPLDEVFASVEKEPLAAGTIGQVHRARLVDGRRVVLKVQRSTAAAVIERDLALLRSIVRGARLGRRLRSVIDLEGVVEELSASLLVELDFTQEAAHLDRMAEILRHYRRLAVPRCHHDLSTERLLVMDEVHGVPIEEAPPCQARAEAARELLAACFHQVLAVGFFHADPHPGNLLWADDRIWLLDLGMVGEVDDASRRRLTLVLLAFWQGDAAFLGDLVVGFSPVERLASIDLDAFGAALAELVGSVQGLSVSEIEIGALLRQVTEISVRHGVAIPTALAMVAKALSQVQLTVAALAPDLDLFDEARRFFVRNLTDRITGEADPARWLYEAEKLRHRVSAFAGSLGAHRYDADRLERTIARTGRAVALSFAGGCALLGAAVYSGARGR